MTTTEKTYQSILRTLSRVAVEALPQIDLYLQSFVVEKPAAKKKPAAPPVLAPGIQQNVSEDDVLTLWTDRIESAQEIAYQIRQRNRRTK